MRIALIILLLTIEVLTFELNLTKQIPEGLIYNGEIYNIYDYPYVVSITIAYPRNTKETCTGSLIHKLLVLTSAHCVYDIDNNFIKVYRGTWLHNSISRKVVDKFVHADYDPDTHNEFISGDVSVLKINKPFPNVEKYINIGGFPDDFTDENGLDCIVIGFGFINKHTMGTKGFMSHVKVKHGQKACRGFNSKAIKNTWEQYLCTIPGQNATCEGDSGGPMICNGLQYGICSFALNFYGEKETICGSENLQTVHVFIFYYREWINGIIESVIPVTSEEPYFTTKKRKRKKKKTKKKSAGELIKPHYTLYNIMISALLFYDVVL